MTKSSYNSALFLVPLLCGLATLGLLFVWQHLTEHRNLASALPLVLLRNRVYAAAVLHTMLTGFPYLLSVYAFPVRFQVVYGRSARDAGLMLLPMLAASAVGTMTAGALNGGKRKVRFVETLVAACALMMLGCGLETTAGEGGDVEPKVLGFLVFVGLGFGLSAAGATMLTGMEAPVWEHGEFFFISLLSGWVGKGLLTVLYVASAQGIVAQVRIFGGSIGIAASTAILGSKTRTMEGGSVPAEVLAHLASDPSALSPDQWSTIRRVYTDALREDMIVCCAVLALAMLITLGVYRRNRVSMEEMMQQRYREETERRRASAQVALEKKSGP